MADILSIVSLVSFVIAGISFAFAVFFWINFRIPKVISYLTGRSARKSIAKMRQSNEASENKSYRPSTTNVKRGRVTDKMPDSEKSLSDNGQTGMLEENKAFGNRADQTAMLGDDATELLLDSEATELLEKEAQAKRKTARKKLRMLDEVIYTHTDEVIE